MRLLVAAIVLLWSLPAYAGITGGSMSGGTVGVPAIAEAAYRTIVIFGDTQAFVNGTDPIGGGGRYNDLDDAMQWIIDNQEAENIDLVLHVGDMIDSGTPLPLSAACDSWTTSRTASYCAGFDASQPFCAAEDGCGWTTTATPACTTCEAVNDTASEWGRFDVVFSKLEGVVPFAFTKGNHDNTGNDPNPGREGPGWDDLYDDTYWNGLEVLFLPYNYNHLAAKAITEGGNVGYSRAWTTEVGGQRMLIVAPAYGASSGISSTALQWAEDTINDYPSLPAILLAHSYGEVSSLVTNSETLAPSLIMVASGHNGWVSGGNQVNMIVDGAELVIDARIDQTNEAESTYSGGRTGGSAIRDTNAVLQSDWVQIIRLYLDEDEGRVTAWSAQGSAFMNNDANLGATRQLPKQTFPVLPPAPFDLSPYEDDIQAVFEDNGLTRPQWPTAPNITSGPTLVTDCAGLIASAAIAGRHTRVATGVTLGSSGTPCGTTTLASDTWLEMQGTATLYGTVTGASNDRIRWTGGTVINPSNQNFSGDDILIQNINVDIDARSSAVPFQADTSGGSRRALVYNSFEECFTYCILFQATSGSDRHLDTIVAGNEVRGGWRSNSTTPSGNNEVASRLQMYRGAIYVANYFENIDGEKVSARFYDSQEDLVFVDNVLENPTICAEVATVGTRPGSIDNARLRANRCFYDRTHSTNAFAIYDSFGGGCTNVDSIDGELITTNNNTYNAQFCGGGLNTGTNQALGDPPYNGTIPTCGVELSCGPQ